MRNAHEVTAAILGFRNLHQYIVHQLAEDALAERLARGRLGRGRWGLQTLIGQILYKNLAREFATAYRRSYGRYPKGRHKLSPRASTYAWFNPEIAALGHNEESPH